MANKEWDDLVLNEEFAQYFFKKRTSIKTNAFNMFAKFTPDQLVIYKKLLSDFIEQHKDDNIKDEEAEDAKDDKKQSTTEIGDALENLITFIFSSLPAFKVAGKIRTNSNEIDHIIMLSEEGRAIKSDNLIDFSQNYFLGESKNYCTRIKVTWINKLYSLLSSTGTRLGVVFSFHGLTGQTKCGGWQEAKGFTKKILLSTLGLNPTVEEEKNAIYLIDFNIVHFSMLLEKSIIEVIENEMKKLKFDVKKEITIFEKHDKEDDVKGVILTIDEQSKI